MNAYKQRSKYIAGVNKNELKGWFVIQSNVTTVHCASLNLKCFRVLKIVFRIQRIRQSALWLKSLTHSYYNPKRRRRTRAAQLVKTNVYEHPIPCKTYMCFVKLVKTETNSLLYDHNYPESLIFFFNLVLKEQVS